MAGGRKVLELHSAECPPDTYSHQQFKHSNNSNSESYNMSGRIMVFALLLLSSVLLLFLFLHMYARCLLLHHRRRRSRFLFQHTDNPTTSSDADAPRGLDASVLASLPVFVFSSETHHTQLECAVCLSDFEEKERGRLLPKCNHSFHIDCIDMWFHSHSTCPLCRAAVLPESPTQLLPLSANRDDQNPESGSGSGFCSSGQVDLETGPSSSSLGSGPPLSGGTSSSFRMKGLEIEVGTKRGESLRDLEGVENGTVSPGAQGLKSPGSRILSLKRIFNVDRRSGAFSTSTSSSVAEADLERGEDQQPRTQS